MRLDFKHLPLFAFALAILWDWTAQLTASRWPPDIYHFMYFGQRLAQGTLHWTMEFDDKLPVVQFLFYIPNLFHSFAVWYLMSMGVSLLGAYAVHTLARDVFSSAKGLPEGFGRSMGLYCGALTLYLFSAVVGGIGHINVWAVSALLTAAALLRYACRRPAADAKTVSAFTAACFCASLAVGIRPYLAILVGLMPVWILMTRHLDEQRAGRGWIPSLRLFLGWNLTVFLFLAGVNVLPYVITGQMDSFIAGVSMLNRELNPSDPLDVVLGQVGFLASPANLFLTLLFLMWLAFVCFYLKVWRADYARSKAAAFDLLALTVIAPLAVQVMILPKHFFGNYLQLFAPFIAVGAVSFVFLFFRKPARIDFILRHKRKLMAPALILCLLMLSYLNPLPKHDRAPHRSSNISGLLDEYGIGDGDFLAPYDQYVHWRLKRHRHGFPQQHNTEHIVDLGWWRGMDIPEKFSRVPASAAEYCLMLESHGPRLIVFFERRPLVDCGLRGYDFHDVSAQAASNSDIRYYFVRRRL